MSNSDERDGTSKRKASTEADDSCSPESSHSAEPIPSNAPEKSDCLGEGPEAASTDIDADSIADPAPEFDFDTFLNSPPVEIVQPDVSDLTEWLERSSRRASRMVLLALLQAHPGHWSVGKVAERMRLCERWGWRRAGDYDRHFKSRCGHPLCPACTEWLSQREARRVLRLFDHVSAGHLDHESMSWVTINITSLPVGGDFKPLARSSGKAIRNLRNRKFAATAWSMEFELELQTDATAKLHAHGLIWHPCVDRTEIAHELRRLFPDDRAVCLKSLRPKNLLRQMERTAAYKADIDLSVSGWGERTPEILAKLIQSYETIRSRGRCGLRLEIGLRPKMSGQK